MKRLVETNRWRDFFYTELHPYPKIVLCYMYDNADNAGFIDYSRDLWLAQLKGKLDDRYSEFTKTDLINSLEDLKEKLLSDGGKKLWIKDFLFHQNKLPLISGTEESDWIIAKLKNNLVKFNNAKEIQTILDSVIDSSKIKREEVEEQVTSKKKVRKIFQVPTEEEFHNLYNEVYKKQKPEATQPAPEHNISDLYDHYKSNGWKVGGKTPIQDLEACIRKAIRRGDEYKKKNFGEYNNENKKSRTETTLNVVDRIIKKNNGG